MNILTRIPHKTNLARTSSGAENVRNFFKIEIFAEIFGKIEKSRFSKKNVNFEKFSVEILKSIFDQKFSIFFHDFFLNRFRILWIIQKWSLEVPRTQRGRVSERKRGGLQDNKTYFNIATWMLVLSPGGGKAQQWNTKIWDRDTSFRRKKIL